MPEGDTVAWTATRLHAALAGRPLVRAELRWPSLAGADLVGASTVEVVARGKHLLHRLDTGDTLHSHLRMEGTWRVRPATERLRPDHRLRAVLGTTQATALGRSLGMLDLVRTRDEHALVGHLGPDILTGEWDEGSRGAAPAGPATQLVTRRLAADERPFAQALLDQRLLAGLGTFWVSEACFAQRVPPWRPASSIGSDDVVDLLRWTRPRMLLSARTGTQSVTGLARRDALGDVHGLSGRPCRRCGDTVRVALVGSAPRERTIFYCPTCQGGLAPTDDGRPQAPLGARARRDRRPGHR